MLQHTQSMCRKALGILGCGAAAFCCYLLNPEAAAATSFQTNFSLANDEFLTIDFSGSDKTQDGLISYEDNELESWSISGKINDIEFSENIILGANNPYSQWLGFTYDIQNHLLMDFDTSQIRSNSFSESVIVLKDADKSSTYDIELLSSPRADTIHYWESIEDKAVVEVSTATTPEPSIMLGFITLGGVMLGSKRKTKD